MINIIGSNKRGGLWTPDQEWDSSELRLWLDASETDYLTGSSQEYLTLNGSNISQWDDRSGNENDAYMSIESRQPSTDYLGYGSKRRVLAKDDGLNLPTLGISGGNPFSVFLVSKGVINAGGGDYATTLFTIGNTNSSGKMFRLRKDDNSPEIRMNNRHIYWQKASSTGFYGVIFPTNNMQDQILDFRATQYTSTTVSSVNNFNDDGGRLFYDSINGYTQEASLQEFIVIKEAIDGDALDKLNGYLAHKYSLTSLLPANHPYKTKAP